MLYIAQMISEHGQRSHNYSWRFYLWLWWEPTEACVPLTISFS